MLSFTRIVLVTVLYLFTASLVSDSISAQDALKEQLKNYDREDIHSIHKKLYTKKGRHELSFGLGGITNGDGYILTTLGYTYHFFETLGLEVAQGGLAFQLGDDNKLTLYQASAIFSPLYGKVSLFTWAVANFDIFVVGGGGVAKYSGTYDGSSFMANVGLGQRFFINDYLSTRIEFRDYFYRQTQTANSKILHNYAITAGISVMYPFHQAY